MNGVDGMDRMNDMDGGDVGDGVDRMNSVDGVPIYLWRGASCASCDS